MWLQENPCGRKYVVFSCFILSSITILQVPSLSCLMIMPQHYLCSFFYYSLFVIHLDSISPATDLIFWLWIYRPCSSLSVFALHPLYLRVQALSENIPQDIKVRIGFFGLYHFTFCKDQIKVHFPLKYADSVVFVPENP